jgi:N-methylhydantoinase B/oxoprolinase/acetone carboxylase alpha subunit
MTEATPAAVGRLDLAVFYQQLVNICDEMAVAMMRTAYSPIFSEGLDFSTLILDPEGHLVATARINPAMLGASLYAATWVINEIGADNLHEGDIWIHNDPYRGGSHMPEHMMITPIFADGQLAAYLGNIAHLAEIGGMSPGSFAANATDIYQEGLRLPPVRLFERGEPVRDIWRIILANHRTPANSWGDLNAMLGSLRVGEGRLRSQIQARGLANVRRLFAQSQDYAESYVRARIRELPDGVYSASDCFDDDGVSDRPYWIRLDLLIEGDELVFDYSRSDRQADGPINAPYVVTLSASLNALLYLIGDEVPINAGVVRPIRVAAPAGSICCVRLPGACVGGQTEAQPKIMEMIMGQALQPLFPGRVAAASGNTSLNFLFGGVHPSTGEYFSHYHFEGNGWGGRHDADGNSAQIVPHANCRNTPVEIFETRWPWVHLRYGLDRDNGGAGRHRGGLGIERVLEVDAEVMTVSALADRVKKPPWGLLGGESGSLCRLEYCPSAESQYRPFNIEFNLASPSKFANVRLKRGDRVRLVSPSGGGFGPPLERDPQLVRSDVLQGFVTRSAAELTYGVIIDEEGEIDVTRTGRLRKEMRGDLA